MALTNSEIEAKLAALEDRISLVSRVTDGLELRLDDGMAMWEDWAVQLQVAMAAVERQIRRLRQVGPPPGRE